MVADIAAQFAARVALLAALDERPDDYPRIEGPTLQILRHRSAPKPEPRPPPPTEPDDDEPPF